MSRLALLAASLLFAIPAYAKEVAGINVPDTLSVEGTTLKLNGAGLRKKFIVKVYVGALYVEKTSQNANELITSDQAKAVKMTFVRNVDKGKIIEAYKEGFEKNSKGDLPKLQPALTKIESAMGDMKSGQWMMVSYAPGKGVTVSQQSGATVTIAADGKTIADAMFRNWLGSSPADDGLKTAMVSGN